MRRRAAYAFAAILAWSASALACSSGRAPVKTEAREAPTPMATPAATAHPAVKASDGNADSARGREERLIAKMLKQVSHARGLASEHTVPGVTLSRNALIAKVKAHVAREIPPEAIRHEGLVLQLFGLVPEAFDYEAETFKLLEAQLAGFYEPSDGTMYMAADLDDENASATLAHELVHALQDQHFDLKPHSKYVPGQSDGQAAFSALAEGDATSAMADVLVSRIMQDSTALDIPEGMFVEQVLASVSSGPAASAPHVMRTSLVAPYIDGTLFVNALRRSGGWGAVDGAWKDLPTTTEQILHVDKFRAHEAAINVKAPTFAALGGGWAVSDEDTYGELGLKLTYEEWMGAERAKDAAAGWGGDRGVLVEGAGRAAIAVHVRCDKGADPFARIAESMKSSIGKPTASDATWVCIERASLGPIAAMKRDRDYVLLAGPAKVNAGGWKSAGDCALAKKWANEVLKP